MILQIKHPINLVAINFIDQMNEGLIFVLIQLDFLVKGNNWKLRYQINIWYLQRLA